MRPFLKWKLAFLALAFFLAWPLPCLAAVPPLDSFKPVLAEGEKAWLFSPAGVKEMKDAQTVEKIVEIWVRVDYPARKITDVLQWHFSPKRNAYKALDAYTYDFKGHLVDQ